MQKCPALVDITFDEKSTQGIEQIKDLHDLAKHGRIFLTIGHLYTIFGGSSFRGVSSSGVSGLLNIADDGIAKTIVQGSGRAIASEASQTAYAITQANWEYFFESFDSLAAIKAAEIHKIAVKQAIAHAQSPKEYKFWKAIAQGCNPQ